MTVRRGIWPIVVTTAGVALAGCGGGDSAMTMGVGNGERTLAPAPRTGRTQAALRIATSSPLVHRVARASRLRLVGSGRWNSMPDNRPLGVQLLLRVHPRIAVDADLPYADIPGDSVNTGECRYPYMQGWFHERASGVSRLWVLVDLRRARVVDMATNARSPALSWVSGKPHPQCRELQG